MLWSLFVIFLVLWLLSVIAGYLLGGLAHILLVMAILFLVVELVLNVGRRRV